MTDTNSIWIVTDDIPQISLPDGKKGGIKGGGGWGEEIDTSEKKIIDNAVEVKAEKLEQEMSRFLLVVDKVFTHAEEQTQVKSGAKSGMQLDEIELSVEINGEGQVKLLGSGVKAGGKGGIKLTFRRKPE
ncbi:Pepco domain-containing protein [Calothrix sp. 336/3]|uniref:Pepco domain-containing protein n=1 Tax=Calothrix sp. 336/3 TaxID=1337936 RepID=UPI0004E38BF3|nr:hypothetical protein [Calothrix sp. 336/3]AKG21753.1 hypothetical protein IJ00_11235 [Calothrix sp. 336/3]